MYYLHLLILFIFDIKRAEYKKKLKTTKQIDGVTTMEKCSILVSRATTVRMLGKT